MQSKQSMVLWALLMLISFTARGQQGSCEDGFNEVMLVLTTDYWPNETTWAVNTEFETVVTGGPYEEIQFTYYENFCVENGCYSFVIYDSYGDGLTAGDPDGSFALYDADGYELGGYGGDFGDQLAFEFCVDSDPLDLVYCMDSLACNFNPEAFWDDGSCLYLDAVGDCGGDCQNDVDADGVCDDIDACIPVLEGNEPPVIDTTSSFFDTPLTIYCDYFEAGMVDDAVNEIIDHIGVTDECPEEVFVNYGVEFTPGCGSSGSYEVFLYFIDVLEAVTPWNVTFYVQDITAPSAEMPLLSNYSPGTSDVPEFGGYPFIAFDVTPYDVGASSTNILDWPVFPDLQIDLPNISYNDPLVFAEDNCAGTIDLSFTWESLGSLFVQSDYFPENSEYQHSVFLQTLVTITDGCNTSSGYVVPLKLYWDEGIGSSSQCGWWIPSDGQGPAYLGCNPPAEYSLAACQACAQEVISNDAFCVENTWDFICQNAYEDCIGEGSHLSCTCDADEDQDLVCDEEDNCIGTPLENVLDQPFYAVTSFLPDGQVYEQLVMQFLESGDALITDLESYIADPLSLDIPWEFVAVSYCQQLSGEVHFIATPDWLSGVVLEGEVQGSFYSEAAGETLTTLISPASLGCSNPVACNYDSAANLDDGSCITGSFCACQSSIEISVLEMEGGESMVIEFPANFSELQAMAVTLEFDNSAVTYAADLLLGICDPSGNCAQMGGYNVDLYENEIGSWPQEWVTTSGGTYTAWIEFSPSELNGMGPWELTVMNGYDSPMSLGSWTGVITFYGPCAMECEFDDDDDSICDALDDCIGAYDNCGVCNGPGAIYACGCSEIPEGDCDCDGGQVDALGVCSGSCTADENGNGICDSDEVSGCTNETACNYNPWATLEDGLCLTGEDCLCPDGIDLDGDGICDEIDNCVGAFDACGMCNGPGAIYTCGCSELPEGDCNCEGHELDALGVCGGSCELDANLNGICDADEVEGCTDESACNYYPWANMDDGTCLTGEECVCYDGVDLDDDGICDIIDDCVGTYDTCGVCNGPGEVYACGCDEMPEGDCDCSGTEWDALGDCGGDCLLDEDNDGICDDEDDCVGAFDTCGTCNGSNDECCEITIDITPPSCAGNDGTLTLFSYGCEAQPTTASTLFFNLYQLFNDNYAQWCMEGNSFACSQWSQGYMFDGDGPGNQLGATIAIAVSSFDELMLVLSTYAGDPVVDVLIEWAESSESSLVNCISTPATDCDNIGQSMLLNMYANSGLSWITVTETFFELGFTPTCSVVWQDANTLAFIGSSFEMAGLSPGTYTAHFVRGYLGPNQYQCSATETVELIENCVGCTDSMACNYDSGFSVETDNSLCVYPNGICEMCSGETDGTGNVVQVDSDNDGICDSEEVPGCMDSAACNFMEAATDDDGSCIFDGPECGVTCVHSIPFATGDLYPNQTLTIEWEGNMDTLDSLAIEFDFTSYNIAQALDLLIGVCAPNGECVELGGYDVSFGYTDLGPLPSDWNTTQSGSFSTQVALNGAELSGSGIWTVLLQNGYNTSNSHGSWQGAITLQSACFEEVIYGCTNEVACNFFPEATEDDGSCFFPDGFGNCGGDCPADADGDGVCDDVDDCVGNYDACGVCNGPGAVLECGCSPLPAGDCDCFGNQADALGICGGFCTADENQNGICDDEEEGTVEGCAHPAACNYDPTVLVDNGACEWPSPGEDCDGNCINDADADGICDEFEIVGCSDSMALNWNPFATDAGECEYPLVPGCMDLNACNYNADADFEPQGICFWPSSVFLDCEGNCLEDLDGDGVCDAFEIIGCMDDSAENFNAYATDEGPCLWSEDLGCTYAEACNFSTLAQADDGSCQFPQAGYDCQGNPITVGSSCLGDLNDSGWIEVEDLLILLSAYGQECD